ncbi:alpha/beta hydrolase [Agaricicola taiwanensis]|uniref:Alpha/beta hydrolase n=2 Tax=Agaricicola taiwanensis TaxID=591372 RepID=A0A8J2YH55_9RHOB|nr:alpha/beta hydrolase [Agaricicola taiwanensis]
MASRPAFETALARLGILKTLEAFDPHVAGTLPLGIDIPGSDIDILCHAPAPDRFASLLWRTYAGFTDFSLRQWRGNGRPIITTFEAEGWPFEIFGSPQPVAEQLGWRHFKVERRLLAQGNSAFRDKVMALRHVGAKTEPAFAQVLGLEGDPYQALLDLEILDDAGLRKRLAAAGYLGGASLRAH